MKKQWDGLVQGSGSCAFWLFTGKGENRILPEPDFSFQTYLLRRVPL